MKKLFKDNIGSVQLLGVFGDEATIVDAARVSMSKEANNFTPQQNAKLINYLIKHSHWTPISQVQVRFRIMMPLFTARQWFKSCIGIVRNEESRRYVSHPPKFFTPDIWRKRADTVKQGSIDEPVPNHAMVQLAYDATITKCLDTYDFMLSNGVAPELARIVLPQSMYVEFVETISLEAMLRVIRLRNEGHAQVEIQQYAKAFDEVVKVNFPNVWKAIQPEVLVKKWWQIWK